MARETMGGSNYTEFTRPSSTTVVSVYIRLQLAGIISLAAYKKPTVYTHPAEKSQLQAAYEYIQSMGTKVATGTSVDYL